MRSALILFGLVAGALAAGCGPNLSLLRGRAAHDLNCAEAQLMLTPLDEKERTWGLRGCGKSATYSWTDESGKSEWVMTKKVEQDQR